MQTTPTREGFDHELEFWRGFVQSERFKQGWLPPRKTPELQQHIYEWFLEHVDEDTRVLDVGSGVVSILHGTIGARNLHAVDPLAQAYRSIFDYDAHEITAPDAYGAEEVGERFPRFFDIVHISNALDHTENPVRALQSLIDAVMPGGFLVVQGFVDEGTYEKGAGLHQWNLNLNKGGQLVVANLQGGVVIMAAEKLGATPHFASIEKLPTGKNWLTWIIQKS